MAFHLGGASAVFAAVFKDTGAFEAGFVEEGEQFGVVFGGFAGEADDEGRADGDAGDAGADFFDEGADVGAVGFTFHQSEHMIGDVLEGHVDVTGDFLAFGDGGDEVIAPVGGVGVEQADPKITGDGIEFAEQGGE